MISTWGRGGAHHALQPREGLARKGLVQPLDKRVDLTPPAARARQRQPGRARGAEVTVPPRKQLEERKAEIERKAEMFRENY